MPSSKSQSEAFSRILIDRALQDSDWDLLNPKQVQFELHTTSGRTDYLLKDSLGRVLKLEESIAARARQLQTHLQEGKAS